MLNLFAACEYERDIVKTVLRLTWTYIENAFFANYRRIAIFLSVGLGIAYRLGCASVKLAKRLAGVWCGEKKLCIDQIPKGAGKGSEWQKRRWITASKLLIFHVGSPPKRQPGEDSLRHLRVVVDTSAISILKPISSKNRINET